MSSGKENGEKNELGHTPIKDWCTVRDKLTLKAKTRRKTMANTAFILWDGHRGKIHI